MNNLPAIFSHEEFGDIRTAVINNEPYLMLNDVCRILELNNVSQVKVRLNKDGVITNEVIDNLGRKQQATFINEANLYKVIFQSRKPEAERFADWVTSEVLPSIRKHGAYLTPQKIEEVLSDPDTIIKLAMQLKEERALVQKQSQIIGELKPKADYVDRILKNKGLVSITQIAKDYGMSGQQMNGLLHAYKIQYKQGDQWLLYRQHHDKGYTHSETVDITRSDGRSDVKMNTKWTQKGRLFLYDLLKADDILPVIERGA